MTERYPDRITGGVPRAVWTLLVVIAGTLSAVLATAAPALAHNALSSSDPADGARVSRPPAAVRLTFLSRLNPRTTQVTITGPDGARAEAGGPAFNGATVRVPLRAGAAGRYTVAYQVASTDGHPIRGDVAFTLTVGVPAAAAPSATAPAAPPPATAPPAGSPAGAGAPPGQPPASTGAATVPTAGGGSGGGGPWWAWLAGGSGLLLAGAGGLLTVRRRRGSAGQADPRGA